MKATVQTEFLVSQPNKFCLDTKLRHSDLSEQSLFELYQIRVMERLQISSSSIEVSSSSSPVVSISLQLNVLEKRFLHKLN